MGQKLKLNTCTTELLQLRVEKEALERELEKVREELIRLRHTDPMTGLASKARMYDEIEHHLAIKSRDKHDVALLFFDLDGFKQINAKDHLLGDKLIIEFGNFLLAMSRAVDIVARFGGDEFCILAPNTDLDKAQKFAKKLVAGLGKYHFGGGEKIVLKTSVGMASTSEGLVTPTDLIGVADKRMFEQKTARKIKQ